MTPDEWPKKMADARAKRTSINNAEVTIYEAMQACVSRGAELDDIEQALRNNIIMLEGLKPKPADLGTLAATVTTRGLLDLYGPGTIIGPGTFKAG